MGQGVGAVGGLGLPRGSRDQRPETVGGPVREAGRAAAVRDPYRPRGTLRLARWAVEPAVRPEPRSERSGARVSLVSRPDQASSQRASASCWSVESGWVVARTWSAICRKKRPYPRRGW
ncbi:hypothetical protein Smic_62280 [Streptomyces microflavus]|uniref:Uncharacterized protein n=1 Tax=Streptomyces microflavus TaxID=1919 RepID=A0A7J0CYX0_STRMI|nr:hypothetical protein Smic_62280 [Streptomyces microflavus]